MDGERVLDEDKMVHGGCLLDFSKAFDMVEHSILLLKMARYGVRGKELIWFTNYFGRRQRVYMLRMLSLIHNLCK